MSKGWRGSWRTSLRSAQGWQLCSGRPRAHAADLLDRDTSRVPGRRVGRREIGAWTEIRRCQLVEQFANRDRRRPSPHETKPSAPVAGSPGPRGSRSRPAASRCPPMSTQRGTCATSAVTCWRSARVAAPLPGGGRAPGTRTARLVASGIAGWRLAPMTCSDRTVILKWTGPW